MKRPDHRFSRSISLWKASNLTQRGESFDPMRWTLGSPHGETGAQSGHRGAWTPPPLKATHVKMLVSS